MGFLASVDAMIWVWLVLSVVFLIVEFVTVGLTSIWFAIGGIIALIVAIIGGPIWLQLLLFVVASIGLLLLTKPLVTKYVNARMTRTNADSLVGKCIVIAERVSNTEQTGMALVEGKEWTVRAKEEGDIFEAGEQAKIVEISGVKLLVAKVSEKKEEDPTC